MNKKIIALLLIAALCMGLAITALAANRGDYPIYDEAELLTEAEESALAEKLLDISGTYDAQLVIGTIDSIDGGSIDEFLNLVYDEMDLGYGENRDGVLLLVCMDIREYRILSNGFAGVAIDSGDIDSIGSAMVADLSAGDYAAAFHTFADECADYLDRHINGAPFNPGKTLIIALVIGFVIALIITGIWKSKLKSVRAQNQANVYVTPGSMHLTRSSDRFMYRHVTRTEKPKSSSSSSGSARSTGGGKF